MWVLKGARIAAYISRISLRPIREALLRTSRAVSKPGFNSQGTGRMSDSAVQVSNGAGKGFFRTFKESFLWNSNTAAVSRVSDRSEEQQGTKASQIQQVTVGRADAFNASESRDDEEELENGHSASTKDGSLGKSKIKSKLFKKKEIVSSSTSVPRVEVCTGKKCKAKGSEQLLASFESSADGRVEIAYTTCMKMCKKGMNVRVTKDGTTFDMHNEVGPQDCEQVLCKHFEW